MKAALYYRHIDPADAPALEQLVSELRHCGVTVTVVHDGDSVEGFDYLFSVGGDGTLLSSVQLLSPALPPVVGINFGHLGFLTTAGKENVALLVQELLEGRFTIEERTLLQLHSSNHTIGQSHNQSFALNEVFIHRREEASLLRTQLFVDGDFVATYAGDGVIVATPTGSTAYSLSCGGPILTPTSRCFVVTPISAHTLTLRPIIIPDTSIISLRVVEGDRCTLGMDSRRHQLDGSVDLTLQRAPFTIRLVRIGTQNFFSAIRDKLMWGTEVRP